MPPPPAPPPDTPASLDVEKVTLRGLEELLIVLETLAKDKSLDEFTDMVLNVMSVILLDNRLLETTTGVFPGRVLIT